MADGENGMTRNWDDSDTAGASAPQAARQSAAADVSTAADTPDAAGASAQQGTRPPAAADLAVTEAVLFASGDPIAVDRLTQITGLSAADQLAALDALERKLRQDPAAGLCLRRADQRVCLATRPDLQPALERLFEPRQTAKLSNAAYEALAVIAYNQPVTRAQIESVRGVNSDNVIGRLLERGLIEVSGHLDAPGRPAQFVTTERFLLDMGLSGLDELQPMELMMYGTLRDFETAVQTEMEEQTASGDGN